MDFLLNFKNILNILLYSYLYSFKYTLTFYLCFMKRQQYFYFFKKRQQLILVPLLTVCEIEYADVRRKQSDCLLKILQSFGQQLAADQWLIVIQIVASLVNGKFR